MKKEINILQIHIYLFTMKRAGLEKMKRRRLNIININILLFSIISTEIFDTIEDRS